MHKDNLSIWIIVVLLFKASIFTRNISHITVMAALHFPYPINLSKNIRKIRLSRDLKFHNVPLLRFFEILDMLNCANKGNRKK